MSGVAAYQAAQGNDSVILAGIGQRARLGWDLKRSGYADQRNVLGSATGATQRVQRALQQPLGDEGIPPRHNDGETHPPGTQATLNCVFVGAVLLPESELEAF